MDIIDAITHALKSNQFFAGGIVLGLVGALVAMLRNAPQKIFVLLKDRFSISIEIRDDAVFTAFAEWLATQRYGATCRRNAASLEQNADPGSRRREPSLIFSPGRGHHIFRHNGKFFWLERTKDEEPSGGGDLSKMLSREYMMLRMWGTNMAPGRAMLQAAIDYERERKRGKSVTYANDGWGRWEECGVSDGRPLHSVVLRTGLLGKIVRDVEDFLAARAFYESRGIPWRRVYLFHGPPRTGKSSLISAIASHINSPMYILSLSAPRMTDDMLLTMMRNAAPGACILMEDIDVAFTQRTGSDVSSVTFSGLLNAIDGVGSQQGRLVFMTTNHRERLDAALLERVDMDQHIGPCDHDQLRRMFLRWFPGEEVLAAQFADLQRGCEITPCAVQRHLMAHRTDAYVAAATTMQMQERV